MPELTLEQALEGLGVKADDVLDSRVFPDRVVVILRSGPKLRWPPLEPVQPAAEQAPASGEREQAKVTAKDVRATAAKRRKAGGE